ncbi:MAG: 1-deoxy-D-xylulose-5-phosphate reductoisomerase [Candidatus Brocadiia bacterium]
MKNIVVAGSTGSIGRNTLKVIKSSFSGNARGYRVTGLVAHSNWRLILDQIKEFHPKQAVLIDKDAWLALRNNYRGATKILCGLGRVREMVTDKKADVVLSAVSGASVGLPISLWTAAAGKTLALANKESLVMAGRIVTELARKTGAIILPIDSEHSAIWQLIRPIGLPSGNTATCVPIRLDNGRLVNRPRLRHIILTASGGPFYKYPENRLRHVTPAQALKHPTWQMGSKITIDSATMMNKALEIIEAHHLFNLPSESIRVLVHPQSLVHGLIELADGTTLAHISRPDMKIPIHCALAYAMGNDKPDNNPAGQGPGLNINYGALTFEEPGRCAPMFRQALELGHEVIRRGGTSGAVLNAANEEAVGLFLKKRIGFTDIVKLTARVFDRHKVIREPSLGDIVQSDNWARNQMKAY